MKRLLLLLSLSILIYTAFSFSRSDTQAIPSCGRSAGASGRTRRR